MVWDAAYCGFWKANTQSGSAVAKLKGCVGRDPAVGEFKYQEKFTYLPTYKIWLITNPKPRIVGTNDFPLAGGSDVHKSAVVDGSDVMRSAIRQLLKKELGIEVIGTAPSFAEALVQSAALKPDVLLMDPHMPDECEYTPKFVKSQILLHTKCIVSMSLWNDDNTKALAQSFSAHVLLDKMKAVLPECHHSENGGPLQERPQAAC
jgi:CheY-like chemotaxis protein